MKRSLLPAVVLPACAVLLTAFLSDCGKGDPDDDACCHYTDGRVGEDVSKEDCDAAGGWHYQQAQESEEADSDEDSGLHYVACELTRPNKAVCCVDPNTGEGFLHFAEDCEGWQATDLPAAPSTGLTNYEQWRADCLAYQATTSDLCDLPASQTIDSAYQASFWWDDADRSCSTASGYVGATLTLDAPPDGEAYPPGFSTANGWVVVASSHGQAYGDTYFGDLPLGERVSATFQGPDDQQVIVEFTLGDPVVVHSVTWPDGSVSN